MHTTAAMDGHVTPRYRVLPVSGGRQFSEVCLYIIVLILLSASTIVDGCWKRSVQPSPPPPLVPTDLPTDDNSTTTVIPHHHRLSCWPEEIRRANCMNGGECFVVVLASQARHTSCRCLPEWIGNQCELKYFDPEMLESIQATTITILVTVLVIAFIFVVVIFAVCSYFLHQERLRCSFHSNDSATDNNGNGTYVKRTADEPV